MINVSKVTNRVKVAVQRGVEAVAEELRAEAVRLIEDPPKTGRIYAGPPFRIGKPPHQASDIGEAPADDSGALKRSGKVTSTGELKAEVSFDAGYARNLEYGIPTGEFPLDPRPFMRPATMTVSKKANKIIEKELFK
jgi:hypothetical protein